MTKDEKRRAFEYKLSGRSCAEIAEELGVSRQAVYEMLRGVVQDTPSRRKSAYPAIDKWLKENGLNPAMLARKMCYCESTVYLYLSGKTPPSKPFMEYLEKFAGRPKEELFKEETDHE